MKKMQNLTNPIQLFHDEKETQALSTDEDLLKIFDS